MRQFRRARLALAATAMAALIAVGCDTTLYLNDDRLEQEITSGIATQMGVSVTVTCPDDRPLQAGDVFQCSAVTADGQTITVQVTQTDNQGNVTWETV